MGKEKEKNGALTITFLISLRHIDSEIPRDHFSRNLKHSYFHWSDPGYFNPVRSDPSFMRPVQSDPGFLSPIRSAPIQVVNGQLHFR